MQRAGRQSLELRYAEEPAAPSSLDESFGSVGDASEPEGERAASLEAGAAQRKRDTFRRSKKGGKGGATRPRQQRRAGDQTGELEKRFAAVRLGLTGVFGGVLNRRSGLCQPVGQGVIAGIRQSAFGLLPSRRGHSLDATRRPAHREPDRQKETRTG